MQNLSKGKRSIIAVLALIFLELFFFRNVLGNGLIGDLGDGRFCTLLTEHWFQFFCGNEKWNELSIFYPADDVLGYSDMFLGYGLFYSVFRALGLNIYLAYKCVVMLVHCIGSFSLFYLLSHECRLDMIWSLFGVLSFSYSSAYSVQSGHTQLFALSLVPVLLILGMKFYKAFHDRKKRNIFMYLLITMYAFIIYTSWYIAFFAALFALLYAIVYAATIKKGMIQLIKTLFWEIGCDWIGYILYGLIILIPFSRIYFPVAREMGIRSYQEVSSNLPEIIDWINVSSNNWMFGDAVRSMGLEGGEKAAGFSIPYILFFILAYGVLRKRYKRERNEKWILLYSLCCTIIISMIIILKLGSNGQSLWFFVYEVFPGASSIRAVVRYMLFLSLPMSIVVAEGGEELTHSHSEIKGCYIAAAAAVLFVSNIQRGGVDSRWNAAEQEAFISGISEQPGDCGIFYIRDSENAGKLEYEYQLDAYEIAVNNSIKTVNGYSGQFPQGWNLWEVCSEDYLQNVRSWLMNNGLHNVYAYDEGSNSWELNNSLNHYVLIDFANMEESESHIENGVFEQEEAGRWTMDEATLLFGWDGDTDARVLLDGWTYRDDYRVRMYLNGKDYGYLETEERNVLPFLLKKEDMRKDEDNELKFVTENVLSPYEAGEGSDIRELGIFIKRIMFEEP